MKKILKMPILLLCLMLSLSIGFLMLLIPMRQSKTASADIVYTAGETIYLVGNQGYTPEHYFLDSQNNSLLANIYTQSGNYTNEKNEETSSFYILTTNKKAKSGFVEGSVKFILPDGMLSLAKKGILYVKTSLGVSAEESGENDKIEVKLDGGLKDISLFSTGAVKTEWLNSEFSKVKLDASEVCLNFKSCGENTRKDKCKFSIYEPKLIFKVVIDKTYFESDHTDVNSGDTSSGNNQVDANPGGIYDLGATNDVLSITENDNYLRYCKNLFKVEYEIKQGKEYASISDGKLLVSKSAPNGLEIKVGVKSRKDSIYGGYTEEILKSFKVNTSQYKIEIKSDFKDPATFVGNGLFNLGKKITLRVTPKENYIFKGWEINNQIKTSQTVYYTVGTENNIKCLFVRKITKVEIKNVDKEYDGTTTITNFDAVIEGKEENHDLNIEGFTVEYINPNVGEREISISGNPKFVGEHEKLYQLSNNCIECRNGIIKKKPIIVTANSVEKEYGDGDPAFLYRVNEHEISLLGNLSREAGETVGEYEITLGNLEEKNPNYSIELIKNYLKINQRDLKFRLIDVEKIYDGKPNVEIEYLLENVVGNDDVSLVIEAEFKSIEVGNHEITFKEFNLAGEDKDNYKVSKPQIRGNINKKPLRVIADSISVVYGYSPKELTFKTEGLVEGDVLTGELSRLEGNDVGVYKINLGSLSNCNYDIDFVSNDYTIMQRNITIIANEKQKIYGEPDPELEYKCIDTQTEEEISADLAGIMTRQEGQGVGVYEINQGSITSENNKNYNITFISNNLHINKRNCEVSITVNNKVYDGDIKADCTYKFLNLVNNDKDYLNATFELEFSDPFVGENKVVRLADYKINGTVKDNYNFILEKSFNADISKREAFIFIENQTKIYGESDKEFVYSLSNLIQGDSVEISLEREEGEDVGVYDINVASCCNVNYEIVYESVAKLNISPKEIEIFAKDQTKIFGDEDPEFTYEIRDAQQLQFNDKLDDILGGLLKRKEGENPGTYSIIQGDLKPNKNYLIIFNEGNLTITKRNVVVTIFNQEKVYGDEDPLFVYETQNIVLGYPVKLKIDREEGEDVGVYTLTSNNLENSRYNIELVSGKLTINPRQITLKADDKFKLYGSDDPTFSASITDGDLQYDDDFDSLISGCMARVYGEEVGEYKISKGTLSIGSNYIISFVNGLFEILPQEIEVSAEQKTKYYGDSDPKFTFTITKGTLFNDDSFTGELERLPGEEIGSYTITKGSLSLNSNYKITFVPNSLIIEKRKIKIIADEKTKIYGDEAPSFTYKIEGGFVDGDVLEGRLDREKPTTESNLNLFEMTGRYLITSTLSSPKYEIEFIPNHLTIKQKEIRVAADNKSKIYGEEDPELTYRIIGGEVFDGAEFSGNVYRAEGQDAGLYDIRSSLSLGRNYKVVFTKGIFEILPIKLKVRTYDYEKTYGDPDPVFEYEIVEGELINDDVLLGGINKEGDELVGKHRLVSAFNNTNYEVELSENYLTINKKDVYLNTLIQDKVYNGDCVAYMKTPVVTGLIDEGVSVSYDKENSARFETCEVGNNIKVKLYNIILTGSKSENYNLILPENIYGNITNSVVRNENDKVSIETNSNTDLKAGIELRNDSQVSEIESVKTASKQVVASYNLWLEDGEVVKSLKDPITVKFELPFAFKSRANYYVYGQNKEGKTVLLTSVKKGDCLEVTTDYLGEFIILSDNEIWVDICVYISFAILAGLGIWLGCHLIKKAKASKNK